MAQAPWYTYPRIDNFGQQDSAGAFWKPDSNIQLPGGYPITALLSGIVTAVQSTDFGQEVVTVKLDSPLNSLATHTFYEHMSDATVAVGQHVNAGDLVGHNNPDGQVPLGFGLYSGDTYGSGSAWTTLQNDLCPGCPNLLNPVALLDAAKNGTLPAQTGTYQTATTGSGVPLIGPLIDWLNNVKSSLTSQFAATWSWLSNPLRMLKLVGGLGLLFMAVAMLIAPTMEQWTGNAAKGVANFGKKSVALGTKLA